MVKILKNLIKLPTFLILLILIQLIQSIYFQRAIFLEKYDISYWQDRFEHSQWRLPLSQRIIGDDGLFAYVGYQMVQGIDPSQINAETPPLGKYLIGYSIYIFNNPAYYALIFGMVTLLILYCASRIILKEKTSRLFFVLIFALDPLFFTQLNKAWLDIPQLFFLHVNIFMIYLALKKNSLILFIISGVFLGFFMETKPPIFFPVIFLAELLLLVFQRKYFFSLIFSFSIGIGIVIPYLSYLFNGHTVMDVINIHAYMISFFKASQLKANIFSIWSTLLFGKFPHLTTYELIPVEQWWVLWPIALIGGLLSAGKSLCMKHTNILIKMIGFFLIAFMGVLSIIPAYPRYIIIVLPFLYLFLIRELETLPYKIKNTFFTLILLIGFVNASIFLASPNSDLVIKDFYYNFSHQYFQDIYQQNIIRDISFNRESFRFNTQNILNQSTIKDISIKEISKNISNAEGVGNIEYEVIYKTQNLGEFKEKKKVYLKKIHNQWKIIWNWNILLAGYQPGDSIQTKIIQGNRGKLINKSGKILAEDITGKLIFINPDLVNKEKEYELLTYLGSLAYQEKIDAVNIFNAYHENSLPNSWTPIVTLSQKLDTTIEQTLASYSGIKMVDFPNRIYNGISPKTIKNVSYVECCTRIYSSYNYHGISGYEKEYDTILSGFDGGYIHLVDSKKNIKRIILEKKEKNGKDVLLKEQ